MTFLVYAYAKNWLALKSSTANFLSFSHAKEALNYETFIYKKYTILVLLLFNLTFSLHTLMTHIDEYLRKLILIGLNVSGYGNIYYI